MQSNGKVLTLVGSLVLVSSVCPGATVTGTVTGPGGTPFLGAFVEAQNTKSRITYMALSDSQGHYAVEKLPPGEYRIQTRAVGYQADARAGLNFTADQNASVDIALRTGTVHWNDLNVTQFAKLWPAGRGKDLLFQRCIICHNFQTRMASVSRDEEGWRDRVEYMLQAMHFSLGKNVTEQDADVIASYLATLYGPNATLPKSPTDVPGYKETVHSFGNDAMNIHYVEYDMPGPSRMPFSAAPAKDGSIWIPNFGVANKITRLDPTTGEMQDYAVPNTETAAVHSAYPAPDGTVWIAEQGTDKLGKWDPKTKEVTQYQDKRLPNDRPESGGSKHTTRVDPDGYVWSTGDPLSRFDPKTGEFTDYWDQVPVAYGIEPGKDGNMWFTEANRGHIGKVDWKMQKITVYTPPTKDFERRIEIDSKGIVWFGEYETGKIGRFDPKTETFREYGLPGAPQTHPYGIAIDANDNIWYSAFFLDELGCLDPKTGKITEYPFPHSENTIRELFPDSQGRIWYGTPANNKVGYFYLTPQVGTRAANQ